MSGNPKELFCCLRVSFTQLLFFLACRVGSGIPGLRYGNYIDLDEANLASKFTFRKWSMEQPSMGKVVENLRWLHRKNCEMHFKWIDVIQYYILLDEQTKSGRRKETCANVSWYVWHSIVSLATLYGQFNRIICLVDSVTLFFFSLLLGGLWMTLFLCTPYFWPELLCDATTASFNEITIIPLFGSQWLVVK